MSDNAPPDWFVGWPEPDEPGRFLIICSCGKWQFSGTAREINNASRAHDDSPFGEHIVTARGFYKITDGGAS
jgi:hypothetical protein